MTKLEKLLYRKSVIESVLPIYQKGAETYKCLVDVLERELPNTTDEVEKSRMAIEILENREKARGFITSFKLNKREYEDYIIPSLQQEREMEEKDGEAYKAIMESMKELAKSELYSDTVVKHENEEQIKIIDSLEKHCSILEQLIDGINNKLEETFVDPLTGLRLEKELFDAQLNILANRKRLSERKNYYYNTFLPKYQSELKEAQENFDTVKKEAEELAEVSKDMGLQGMLIKMRTEMKSDDDKWATYIALKDRIAFVRKALKKGRIVSINGKKI